MLTRSRNLIDTGIGDLGASLPLAEGILGNKSRARVFSLYRTAAKAGFLRREAKRNTSPKYA